ncbi:glycosyltransferase [Amylibacter sp.]|nr:glycosyltransferase [Amylibacter sp.]
MPRPDISVIIPCFNGERWISFAIESALSQEGVNIEVIVVDDGSTDSTNEILGSFSSRVTVIHKKNGGVGSARNAGILKTSGRYIRFLDADDVFPQNSMARVYDFACQSPNSILVGKTNLMSHEGRIIQNDAYNIPVTDIRSSKIDALYLLTQATHSTLWLIPRHILTPDVHFSEELSLGEEYDFSRKLINLGHPFLSSTEIFCTIRQHDGKRLSRQGKDADYLRQLNQIRQNADYILGCANGKNHPAKAILARRTWVLGRDCARAGYMIAARNHFEFALSLGGREAIVGHWTYQMLARWIGPMLAERGVSIAKRTRL